MTHPSRSLSGRMSVGVQSDPTELTARSLPWGPMRVASNFQTMRPICDNGQIIFGQRRSKKHLELFFVLSFESTSFPCRALDVELSSKSQKRRCDLRVMSMGLTKGAARWRAERPLLLGPYSLRADRSAAFAI